ncbi:response regulator [Candidatus Woesearchaeota archaeon]|nr:response regulator [Candidatus Woesearchaeota archaeon]
MDSLPCKFPRLFDKYVSLMRGGDSEADARKNAETALAYKGVFSPLDTVFIVTKHESRGVPFFEATLFYLHNRFKDQLTEIEHRRLNGQFSKLLFVDDNGMLERSVNAVIGVGIYAVQACSELSEVVDDITYDSPDLLVLRHDLKSTTGFDVLKSIRQNGIEQKTIVYSRTNEQLVVEKYLKMDDVWYYLYIPHDHQLRDAVEKSLNGIKGKTFKDFYVP